MQKPLIVVFRILLNFYFDILFFPLCLLFSLLFAVSSISCLKHVVVFRSLSESDFQIFR